MDRARRAEPYSNATIWTREIARNLAGHLARISKAHSCVDTKSPKTRLLPKFQHSSNPQKRCATSPVKVRHPHHAAELHNAVKGGDESGPEQRDDEEEIGGEGHLAGEIDRHVSQTARNGEDDSGRTELRPVRQHRKLPKKKPRNPSKKSRMEADRLEMIAHENQRLQERLTKIATPNGKHQQHQSRASSAHHHPPHPNPSDDSTIWDASLDKPLSKNSHDYNKKQEQLKIWNENQALAKRLRTAKPTLNCKEWEKDDKWNQHFLKSQEKRRIALQHELAKAQMSPLAAVRVAKINHHEDSPGTRSPSSTAFVSMGGGMHDHAEEDSSRSNNDRATAANHRRIMMLRKQRSAPSKDQKHAHHGITNQVGNQFDVGSPSVEENCENDVVNVRFTFSRERRRSSATESADSLTIEAPSCFGVRDNLFELGAFSPAVELESALEAMAMNPIEPEASVPEDECAVGGGSHDFEKPQDASQSPLKPRCAFTDDEINAVVFDTLQDSIDSVADALSDQQEGEQHSSEKMAAEQQQSFNPPVAIDKMLQSVPVPLPEAEDATEFIEGALCDAVDAVSSLDSALDAANAVEVSGPVSASTRVHEAESDDERIPHSEEVAQKLDHVSVVGSEADEASKTDDASLDDPPELQKAVLTNPTEPPHLENNDASEEQESEYGEENFDDDPHEPETTEPGADAAHLDPSSPEEAQQTAVESDDEASGYGSEFDEDQDQQQQQPEDSVAKEAEAPNGDEDEDYDDHYDDDEAPESPSRVANGAHEQQKAQEDELSYSDDGFSEGEDTG